MIRRVLLPLFLFLQVFGQSAHALEIPNLTWERGKSLNVVLGGYAESLQWRIYLEDSKSYSLELDKSRRSDSGFYVYTATLPRNLATGAYKVVARDNQGAESIVAAVQVVERFQYELFSIPRDFLFLVLGLAFILTQALSVRIWSRRRVDFSGSEALQTFNTESAGVGSALQSSLLIQRDRWQSRWFGKDWQPVDVRGISGREKAYLPLIGVILALYFSLSSTFVPIADHGDGIFLALLGLISVLDRYSSKLIAIAVSIIFVVFNSTLNFPTLLSFGLTLSIFLVPQYVGDLSREFFSRELLRLHKGLYFSTVLGSLTAGISVFWLYLFAQSVTQSGTTNATLVTPAALAVSLGYLLRTQYAAVRQDLDDPSDQFVKPVISFTSLIAASALFLGGVLIWSTSFSFAIAIAALFFLPLTTLHFRSNVSFRVKPQILERAGAQVLILFALSTLFVLVTWELPLVVADRSKLALLGTGVITSLYAVFCLITSDLKRIPLQDTNETQIGRSTNSTSESGETG